MPGKRSKAKKAKHQKIHRKTSTRSSNEPSSSEPSGSTTQLAEKNAEEQKRKLTEKFSKVLMSTLDVFSFNQKNNIPTEVLMLIFTKGRWNREPESLSPSWVKLYNRYGRIDGPGFNYMRRDFRSLINAPDDDPCKLIKKFPFGSETKEQSILEILEKKFLIKKGSISKKNVKTGRAISKRNVRTGQTTSKQNVQTGQSTTKQNVQTEQSTSIENAPIAPVGPSTSKQEVTEEKVKTGEEENPDDDDDESSEEEDDSCNIPGSLLTELRRDCVKKSAAANIAIEIICESNTQLLLKRLLIFEKHQLVAEWEIAKKAYTLRNLNWKIAPGMINLCDEIAKEMIEIDRTIEAISCFGRYEMASYLMRTIKGCVKARLQRKRTVKKKHQTSARRSRRVDESDEESDDDDDDDDDNIIYDESSESEEFEEVKRRINKESEKEMMEIKQHLAKTFIDLLRATEFFAGIRKSDYQELDFCGHSNYRFYQLLCAMHEP